MGLVSVLKLNSLRSRVALKKLQFEEGSTVNAQIGSRLHLRVMVFMAKDELYKLSLR